MQHNLNLTTVICNNCSFVFTNPLPPQDTYERFYVEAYEKFYKYTLTRPASGFGENEPAYFTRRLDWIESVNALKGLRLLDVGPGQGGILWWARRRGAVVMGIEPSPLLSQDLANLGLPCVCSSFGNLQMPTNKKFDIIVMSHVLEHFYDPNPALEKCRTILADSGILVVEVPNILKPFRSLDRYFLRYVHPSSFSPQTLQGMLEKHGFSVKFIHEIEDNWHSPPGVFAIAYLDNEIAQHNSLPGQSAEEVSPILKNYRRRWVYYLGAAWHVHRVFLKGRRLAYRVARRMKRTILYGRS
jgi:SAM-dependent methyltransferase